MIYVDAVRDQHESRKDLNYLENEASNLEQGYYIALTRVASTSYVSRKRRLTARPNLFHRVEALIWPRIV